MNTGYTVRKKRTFRESRIRHMKEILVTTISETKWFFGKNAKQFVTLHIIYNASLEGTLCLLLAQQPPIGPGRPQLRGF